MGYRIDPRELFGGLKLLVVDADIPAISRATAERLTAYAKAGGCLAAVLPAGKSTGWKRPSPISDSWPVWGLRSRPLPKQKEGLVAHGTGLLSGETLTFNNSVHRCRSRGGGNPGKIADGTPCVLRCPLGAGEITSSSGMLTGKSRATSGCLVPLPRCSAVVRCYGPPVPGLLATARRDAYVFAYYADKRRDPTHLPPPASAKVQIRHLAAAKYTVTELIGNQR